MLAPRIICRVLGGYAFSGQRPTVVSGFLGGQLPPQGLRTACYASPSTRSFSIFSPSFLNSPGRAGLCGCSGEDRRPCALPCVPLSRGNDVNEVTPGEMGVWRWQFCCLSGPRAWGLSGCFLTCPLGTNRCRETHKRRKPRRGDDGEISLVAVLMASWGSQLYLLRGGGYSCCHILPPGNSQAWGWEGGRVCCLLLFHL